MMDLSDGLGPDLRRICAASKVSACIEGARVPRRRGCSLTQALTDGEDFELLMAVAEPDVRRLLQWASRHLPCGLHRIGRILPLRRGETIAVESAPGAGVPLSLEGFRHF